MPRNCRIRGPVWPAFVSCSPLPSGERGGRVSAADAQAGALEEGFDLLARDPGEVARDRVLEGAGRHAVVEALLQVAVEQSVDQPRRERVAGAETIDNLDLIGPRAQ